MQYARLTMKINVVDVINQIAFSFFFFCRRRKNKKLFIRIISLILYKKYMYSSAYDAHYAVLLFNCYYYNDAKTFLRYRCFVGFGRIPNECCSWIRVDRVPSGFVAFSLSHNKLKRRRD